MADYLVFRLYGPLASWGEIAVGEIRPTASHPGRSAILGLLCAALGIRRTESARLSTFFSGYDIAVKMLYPGTILHDYHTIQVPSSSREAYYATRRDELTLGKETLNTILSSREYLCDSVAIISVRARKSAPYDLSILCHALEYPKFVLYLGRKSCPLGLPMKPQLIAADGFKQSFSKASFPAFFKENEQVGTEDVDRKYQKTSYIEHAFGKTTSVRYYWDGDAKDMEPTQIFDRYDQPLDRSRWQFRPRKENYMPEEP
jgi:CRISPR system Cascade subunit CasD